MIAARIITAIALIFLASTSLWAQSFLPNTTSRYSGVGSNLAPSNPLSMPAAYGGPSSDLIPITSGMLGAYMPTIPNLELGFQYFFGNKVRSGQASFDYLLPFNVGNNSVVFGEAHGNWWNFAQRPTGGASNRVDLSIGGGYRKILADQLLVGINGFYDTSRLFNNWYSSGGVGLEFAANIGSSDAVDLNANWYGDIFSSSSILNAFRNKGGSYDIEAGYSHAMFNQALDLRIKFAGYQFDTGSSVYGYKTGADLTTKDGMFMLRYEYGNDRINGAWNNIGAFVNIGFQMENILKGESPFTMPEPIFKSPRNLGRMMAQKVKRDWNQQYAPGRAALAAAAVGGGSSLCRTITDQSFTSGGGQAVNFSEGIVPYTELTNDGCITITFNWTSDVDQTGSIYIYMQDDPDGPGTSVLIGNTARSGKGGTVSLSSASAQKQFIDNLDNPKNLEFFFALPPLSNPISISNVVICFNQVCD